MVDMEEKFGWKFTYKHKKGEEVDILSVLLQQNILYCLKWGLPVSSHSHTLQCHVCNMIDMYIVQIMYKLIRFNKLIRFD